MKKIWAKYHEFIMHVIVVVVVVISVHYIHDSLKERDSKDIIEDYESNKAEINISIDSLNSKKENEIKGIFIITNDSTLQLFKELCND